jgi:hypothetical protein
MTPEQEMRVKTLELAFLWKTTLASAAIQKGMGLADMNPMNRDELDQIYQYISVGTVRPPVGKR